MWLTSDDQDNGTVKVINTAQAGGRTISVIGTAKPAGLQYGFSGVFQVEFPQSTGFECPGPNYIVQGRSYPRNYSETMSDPAK
jgi:apolipoprotein D and lipocalin family protein